jgi:hypothetical protein
MTATTFRAFADTLVEGQCRSCRAAILWVELVNGGRHPLNVTPAPERVHEQPGLFGGATIIDLNAVSHFATCPHAAQWR